VVTQAATIVVVRRGWHTDIGFETAELAPPLASVSAQFPGAIWLFFGFGDRRYLQSKQRGAATMLAALVPGPALILATALNSPPADAFGRDQVISFDVSNEQALGAQRAVWSTLQRDQQQSLMGGESGIAGPYEGSLYFEAGPRYSAAHTCNTWTAEVLASGGLAIRPRHVLFAGQLWRQVKHLKLVSARVHAARKDGVPN